MEGTYRIHGGEQDLLESFVAAPGPAGWRYFGRVLTPPQKEVWTVDFVVDNDWRLVRYRERRANGDETAVLPTESGMDVMWRTSGGERSVRAPDADVVWTRSPCSLLIADRRSRALGVSALQAVRVEAPDRVEPMVVALSQLGEEPVRSGSGSSTARKLRVEAGGPGFTALIRDDVPLSAEGWFDLIA